MSQAVEYARNARQSLAAALMAIQTSQEIPDDLMAVADMIAETMGILHRIERSGGTDLGGRDQAISNVRGALSSLQQISPPHRAVDATMDSVAASLGNLYALSKLGAQPQQPQPQSAPQAQPQAWPQPQWSAPPAQPQWGPAAQQPIQPQPQPIHAQPQPIHAQPQPIHAQPQPIHAQPQPIHAQPQPIHAQPQPIHPQPQPIHAQPQPIHPQPQPIHQQPQPTLQARAAQTRPEPHSQAPGAPQEQSVFRQSPGRASVDVELGTSSASNFYKGLSGNDVIEHGGIFVATYKLRPIGEAVELRVLMPGNYEFYASGIVQWIREPSDGQSEPGFGARFTQITPEGRQLVYRYARNREPLFFDDL